MPRRSRGHFSTLRAAPQAPRCRRGPRRVPFVTLSRALLCQHGVGKWLCLTRTCWVCDLAGLAAACASPKQQQSSPLPGTALPSPAAPWRWCGESSAEPALHAESRRQAAVAAHPVSSPHLAVPCAVPTMRTVGVLIRAKFSPYPRDILSFICASSGKFRARSPPPHHVSAAPAASSRPSHQSPLLSMHCDADFFFMFCCLERKREKG